MTESGDRGETRADDREGDAGTWILVIYALLLLSMALHFLWFGAVLGLLLLARPARGTVWESHVAAGLRTSAVILAMNLAGLAALFLVRARPEVVDLYPLFVVPVFVAGCAAAVWAVMRLCRAALAAWRGVPIDDPRSWA